MRTLTGFLENVPSVPRLLAYLKHVALWLEISTLLLGAPPPPEAIATVANCRGQAHAIGTASRVWRLPDITWAAAFSEDRAVASNGKKLGYIDRRGLWRVHPVFETAYPCTQGLCAVCIDIENRYAKARCGYVDLNGNPAIEFVYEDVRPFVGDYALTRQGSETVVITKTGAVRLRLPGRCFSGGQAGLIACEVVEGFSFIDITTGKTILGPYQRAGAFEAGVAPVKPHGSAKWHVIDLKGQAVSDKVFDRLGPFAEGVAAAWTGEHCGYVSTSGLYVIPPNYFSCETFSHGVALVRGSDGLHFIDGTGTVAIPGPFQNAKSFENGFAWTIPTGMIPPRVLYLENRWFRLINSQGRAVFTCDDNTMVEKQKHGK